MYLYPNAIAIIGCILYDTDDLKFTRLLLVQQEYDKFLQMFYVRLINSINSYMEDFIYVY